MAPSELPIPGTKLLSRAMTESDIHRVIDDYVKAIGRSRTCRIDGVQLHCAHGFLLCSFISPFLNRREDDWGGNTERRTRIIVEILRKAKKKIPNYPIAVKMNVIDGVPGGIDLSEAVKIAKILSSEGVDAIETSGGIEEAPKDLTSQLVTSPEQEAYFREYSRAIKNKVDCPVILVGGLRSLKIMHQMIADGYADMISMSRPLVRDPLLVAGLINGRKSEATCVSCNNCFDESGVKCNRSAQKK
jgi:2,4-dienoyl-CoA reductase-like NADH-dependent reductase (Old Yellow Enzyme family)